MMVIQSLLLSTELLLTITGSQGDSKVSCSQRNLAWNGCMLPKVKEGTSSDKEEQDEITDCICAYFIVCFAQQMLLVKTTTALQVVVFSLPKPLEILVGFFFSPEETLLENYIPFPTFHSTIDCPLLNFKGLSKMLCFLLCCSNIHSTLFKKH